MTERSTDQSAAISELARLIEVETEAELRYKEQKARTFLSQIDQGAPATVAWQMVAANRGLAGLEREARHARAERLCCYLGILSGSGSVPSLGLGLDWDGGGDG